MFSYRLFAPLSLEAFRRISQGEIVAKRKVRGSYEPPVRRAEPAEHWRQFRRGDRVSVKLTPGDAHGGLVDEVSYDFSIVWVNLDGGHGRRLVHCSDGIEIIRHQS